MKLNIKIYQMSLKMKSILVNILIANWRYMDLTIYLYCLIIIKLNIKIYGKICNIYHSSTVILKIKLKMIFCLIKQIKCLEFMYSCIWIPDNIKIDISDIKNPNEIFRIFFIFLWK